MSDKLPAASGQDVIRTLRQLGYTVDRQEGSHVTLTAPSRAPVTVPAHATLAKGTLRAIIRDAGLTRAEFMALWRSR